LSSPDRPWLDEAVVSRLEPMLELLASDPASLSSVTDPSRARDIHIVDSLSGLVLPELKDAGMIGDIGSGAGFPGVPLAAALPESKVEMIESVSRKTAFIDRAIEATGLTNASTVTARSEEWAAGEGRERYDVITARAVADLSVLAELASPLLRDGGSLIAYKGERETDSEAHLADIEAKVAMKLEEVQTVRPFRASRDRHLYVIRKSGKTPSALPRRPGMARKRPLKP